MNNEDPLFNWGDGGKKEVPTPDYWGTWRIVDLLSICEASRLLAGLNPKPQTNRMDSDRLKASKADAYNVALIRAVQCGNITPFRPLAWFNNGYDSETCSCDPESDGLCDATTISVGELARWADRCGVRHRWPIDAGHPEPYTPNLDRYPPELQAAIEAFDAVSGDPAAFKGKSPKSALIAWLEQHKPELSDNARERIATVANWQPTGGAPKTPGE